MLGTRFVYNKIMNNVKKAGIRDAISVSMVIKFKKGETDITVIDKDGNKFERTEKNEDTLDGVMENAIKSNLNEKGFSYSEADFVQFSLSVKEKSFNDITLFYKDAKGVKQKYFVKEIK